MKNLTYLSLVFAVLITSCKDTNQYSHIEVYNNFNEEVEFTLNNERHTIKSKGLSYFASPKRAQLFQFGQVKELIKTKENERFLINLALDTIIKEELLYGSSYSSDPNASGGSMPSNLIKLRGNKYFGPYEVITQKLTIRKYDFSMNEKAPSMISSNDANWKGRSVYKNWTEYFKLSTVDEFVASRKSLNESKEFIFPIVLASAKILNNEISITMQQQAIFLKKNGEGIGDISSARVTSDDRLELLKPRLYNKEKDGAIKEKIIIIPDCSIVLKDGTKNKDAKVDIVLVENHPNARVVVR